MAAVLALTGMAVYAARSFCSPEEEVKEYYEEPAPPPQQPVTSSYNVVDTLSGGLGGVGMNPQQKAEQPHFGEIAFMKHVNGEPVHDFRNRPYVSGKMNNLSPTEKNLVGPGLNVGPDVPAYGGYQQLFRVKPNNVGEYKLTTLPGRTGPAGDTTGGRGQLIGELTHDKPSTTAYLPERRPTVRGRGQGQGGALTGVTVRENYMKTQRPTNRSETTARGDGLEFSAAKRFISAPTLAEDPTRNKGDINVLQYSHAANPTPGIYSFYGGYTENPQSKLMAQKGVHGYTSEQLQQYGIRPADRRGNRARNGNAGRMNVRADPLNQGGMVTAVRSDTSRIDGRVNAPNGGWSQNYVKSMYSKTNSYKGNVNPYGTTEYLRTARKQLDNNPLAQTLAA